jgi:hypothetical protein
VIEAQKKTIGDLDFELSPLPAWKAMETFARLSKFLSPAVESLGAVAGDKEAGAAALAKAIAGLANNKPEELQALTKVLLDACLVTWEGKQVPLMRTFDVVMQGRILTVFKLLAWAVEVNYRDFFDALKGGLGTRLAGLQSALQRTPSTSGPVTG